MDCIVHGVTKSWTQLSAFTLRIQESYFPLAFYGGCQNYGLFSSKANQD